ncbi:MAG TPA: hypothetical protein VGO60_00630 [Iamia sp.]|jgi:hypothetical protein|nr:hypothetical protein [Iamia sp.]
MAPSPRTPVPLGDRPRRLWARSRRISVVAVVATVLGLGGAVAAVYTTGVTLGTHIAPSTEDDARPAATDADGQDTSHGAGAPGSSATEGQDDGSLPDRAENDGSTSTGSDPSTTDGGTGNASGATPDGAQPVEPYPGLWPYVTWQEVVEHAARGDGRYRTPTDTALRFASEVVGLAGASVGTVSEDGVVATVEIRSGQGSTLVTLTHATTGRISIATPWSVAGAVGDVSLDAAGGVGGASLQVTTSGAPGVVGVHDRTTWRGIGVAPTSGAPFDLRIDPGAAGPAIAVALAGDPRAPASFTVRRVQLGGQAGAAAPAAPADPLAATAALVDAVSRGDVGATWELLDPAARRSVLDWRGLAGRMPSLRDQLGRFGSGSFTTTSVTTPAGTVAVVAPEVSTEGVRDATPLAALAFRVDGGARLASTEAASISWNGPEGDDPSVLASGATRPLALVVDGAVWSSTPDGATGLRASTETLLSGAHLAIAVSVQGEQITASAFLFVVTDTPVVAVEPTPPTEPPPAVPPADTAPGARVTAGG